MVNNAKTEQADELRRMIYVSLPEALRRAAKARACLKGRTLGLYIEGLVAADLREAGMTEMLGAEEPRNTI